MEIQPLIGELTAREGWSEPALRAHQRGRLTGLLRHAVQSSPYYSRVLPRDAEHAQLDELPTLPKTTLMEHFDEIVTDERLSRRALEAHLSGPRAGEPLHGYRVISSGGTTGVRGVFVFSEDEFAVWVAAFVRASIGLGIRPGMRGLSIGSSGKAHLSWQVLSLLAGGAAPSLFVTTPIPELVEAANAMQPETLGSYTSVVAALADEQRAGRLRIAPSVINVSAEVLTDGMRRRIVEGFGIDPQQTYQASEVPIIASVFPGYPGLRLWEDLTLVEVVDDQGRPVPPGVPGQKLLVTNLVNHTLPLIRYELSDSVTLAPEAGAYRSISRVEGRREDIITLAGAKGGDVLVHPAHLHAPFTTIGEVAQYQFTLDDRGLSVAIVVGPGVDPAGVERLVHDALHRELAGAGARPPSIDVTAVDAIEREPGAGSKLKLMRSR